MINDEFELYRTKYLFLLVGENPLPNYVAAKLLLDPGGTLYLIHSTSTDIQAVRLAKVLKSEGIKSERVLLDDESDAYRIKKRVGAHLEQLGNGSVGLHYSGGTKAMAVHAYSTLLEHDRETVFSYLSSRQMKIFISQNDQSDKILPIHHKDFIRLDTIFDLHGMKWKADYPPERETQLPDLARLFVHELVQKKQTSRKKENVSWLKRFDSLSTTQEPLPSEVIAALKSEGYVSALEEHGLLQPGSDFDGFKKNWLRDNRWFEQYVLQEIQKVKVETSTIRDCAMDFKIPSETRDGFQFDIAFTHGYQLFALSCTTTDNYKTCKGKLLEAYIRAQQMGGSEARVALVCCSDETDGLRKELTSILKEKQIKVFGRKHLLSLADEIKKWIRENDMELDR